jgi:histidyl-tRNA synthetase
MAGDAADFKPEATPLRAVKGMNDILPPDSWRWDWLEGKLRALMVRYGYRTVRTPIVEPTALFVRGLGEVTDIVEKEMYSFVDSMNGDRLTLRPENTAGVVRAMNEHSFLHDGGKRLFYIGPMFRHERPQKGRYRQFHQAGAEALGFAGPDVDAELILMCRALWRELGLEEGRDVRLDLNCLGQADERRSHRAALVAYFEAHADRLDDDSRRRLQTNPLRILDSKNPHLQALIDEAPKLLDHLGDASRAHFDGLRTILDAAGLAYRINPRLVRGLDYYNLTVFEWVTERLGAQGTVCGGGRYDPLIEQLGGRPTPAVGWAIGLERLLLLLDEIKAVPDAPAPAAYAVIPHARALPAAMVAIESLRALGVSVLMHPGQGSMKSQFKRADASGARYALVFGDDELARDEVAIKPLREPDAPQHTRPLADLAAWAREILATA